MPGYSPFTPPPELHFRWRCVGVAILALIVCFALAYAAVSFVAVDLDFRAWTDEQRATVAMFTAIFGGLGALVSAVAVAEAR